MRSRRSGQAAASLLTLSQTAVDRAASFWVGVQGGAPSVHPVPRIVHQLGEDEFPPTADRRVCRVPHHWGNAGDAGTR
jgi:hypothetical protein